jgi:signal transduction histidine kinase
LNDPSLERYAQVAHSWVQTYRSQLIAWWAAAPGGQALPREVMERLIEQARALRAQVQGLVEEAQRESLALAAVMSHLVVYTMAGGLGLLLLIWGLFQRGVVKPLRRMAEGIEHMRRTARLVKLPVAPAYELGIAASGFNQLAEEVEQQKQRLREHIVELQRANLELDRLAGLKDEFLATVNHQLRTPLTSIIAGMELLRDTHANLTGEQRTLVATVIENARQLDRLVEHILELSMLKSNRRPLQRQPTDLGLLLRTAQQNCPAGAEGQRIRITHGPLPLVFVDKEAVQEVVGHLLRNALRHAQPRTDVLVAAGAQQEVVRIAVSNHGLALNHAQVARLFEPFVHVQTPDAPGSQGHGLGLAFCRQVIERHRGTITAESREGTGTTVTFTLPIASEQFVLEDGCRIAAEEAEQERGSFALLLITPAAPQAASETLVEAEQLLRRSTHRGDQFVRMGERALVILAVTDETGLHAMLKRLHEVLAHTTPAVRVSSALFPVDGTSASQLLAIARSRLTVEEAQAQAPDVRRPPKANGKMFWRPRTEAARGADHSAKGQEVIS